MIQIAQFNTTDQAMMAQGMLESHGIEAQVQSNSLTGLFPGAGSVPLYVAEDQAAEATKLLEEHGDI